MSETWRAPRGALPSVVDVYRCPVCGFRAEWPRIKEHVMDAHPEWGGKRTPGPGKKIGRPLEGEAPVKRHTVWLTDAQTERLRELGGGSLSAGLRKLLEAERF